MKKIPSLTFEQLQILFSNLEEGIVLCDNQDVVLYMNYASSIILYHDREELIGKKIQDICTITFDKLTHLSDEIQNENNIGHAAIIDRHGDEREIHTRFLSGIGQENYHIYILNPVGMMSASLVNDREKLKIIQASRMRALGELATGMAHELSQPLSIISLNTGLLQRKLKDEKDKKIPEKLDQIHQQVQRASDFILHLRQFTKPSAVSIDRTNINEAVESSLLLLRHRMNRENIRIEMSLSENLPRVECRYADVEQIILQCVLNSIDALESDSKKEKRLAIKTEMLETELRVCVEDNGGGIAEHILHHIFTPFFSSKRDGEGMGLGLAVCQLLADDMNSTLTVSTSLGVGTVVRLHIPLSQCLIEPVPSIENKNK